ncbi:hypothetical protein INR49_015051 [Caranx melampygus]|nr:hypothetical protein INR49_015051 [Caranx melampygus]
MESLGGPAGERPSLSGPSRLKLPSGACPTRMPVCCELVAVRLNGFQTEAWGKIPCLLNLLPLELVSREQCVNEMEARCDRLQLCRAGCCLCPGELGPIYTSLAVPDFGIDVLSTNGSQEPHGPGLLKVSGLERSQERSQESCREPQPPAPSTPDQPLPTPQEPPLSLPQAQPSVPRPPSPHWTQANGPTQAPASTHLPPRSEALPRPQTPAALPLAQGQEPSPPPPPRPQHQHQPELLSHPGHRRRPAFTRIHHRLPSQPTTPTNSIPVRQGPTGLHRAATPGPCLHTTASTSTVTGLQQSSFRTHSVPTTALPHGLLGLGFASHSLCQPCQSASAPAGPGTRCE